MGGSTTATSLSRSEKKEGEKKKAFLPLAVSLMQELFVSLVCIVHQINHSSCVIRRSVQIEILRGRSTTSRSSSKAMQAVPWQIHLLELLLFLPLQQLFSRLYVWSFFLPVSSSSSSSFLLLLVLVSCFMQLSLSPFPGPASLVFSFFLLHQQAECPVHLLVPCTFC